MSKTTRNLLIGLAVLLTGGLGWYFLRDKPDPEQSAQEAKIAELESRYAAEKVRAARFEARAITAEAGEQKATARADSLAKHRKTVYIVKHEKIRNSPDVGPDSLNRYFTAHKASIYSDTTGGNNTP